MVEAGESPLQAALRELSEETGMGGTDLVWGEGFYETERYGPGKVARYYLGAVEERPLELPVSQELGRPEHDEYRWLSVAAAQRLLVPRVAAALEWATAKILAASSDGHGAPTSAT
jgi:bis(5'-nucleosidyl)-tetraphosphatase